MRKGTAPRGSFFTILGILPKWLFTVARNLLIDQVREQRFQTVEDDIEDEETVYEAIDLLALSCLSRVLEELPLEER